MTQVMVYIDICELTVRLAEACLGQSRPNGVTAAAALDQLNRISTDSVQGWERAALAAAEYIAECVNAIHPNSIEIKRVSLDHSKGIQ